MSWVLDALVTTVGIHAVGALVVLNMPHVAIDSAQLVPRLDGMNVVRSRPANATRFAGVFDINIFQTSRFGFGGAILLRPTSDWLVGADLEMSFAVSNNLWIRCGAGITAFSYTRLSHGVVDGAPLTTVETAPSTDMVSGMAPNVFIGAGVRFGK